MYMTLYFINSLYIQLKGINESFELPPYITVPGTSRVTLTMCDNDLTYRDRQTRPYCDSHRGHHSRKTSAITLETGLSGRWGRGFRIAAPTSAGDSREIMLIE